jgi:hypothetical protein
MVTHSAFSDDSGGAEQRYQSLSLVTLQSSLVGPLAKEVRDTLQESDVTEFKWQKLRSAKYHFAAQKLIDFLFQHLNDVRVDTLIWDHADGRHARQGRDENENRVRMYYHLVSTTLGKRWPVDGSIWHWKPDQQSGVDWKTLWDCLRLKRHVCVQDLFNESPDFERVSIEYPVPSESHLHEFIQIADLFAGIGAFSWENFNRYEDWLHQEEANRQTSLFLPTTQDVAFSNAEKDRFQLMSHLKERCSEKKLQVSLTSTRGFSSNRPSSPINFWLYKSRFSGDKAPSK